MCRYMTIPTLWHSCMMHWRNGGFNLSTVLYYEMKLWWFTAWEKPHKLHRLKSTSESSKAKTNPLKVHRLHALDEMYFWLHTTYRPICRLEVLMTYKFSNFWLDGMCNFLFPLFAVQTFLKIVPLTHPSYYFILLEVKLQCPKLGGLNPLFC